MVGGGAARRHRGIGSRVTDSSHPINVQMPVDYMELEMQEERDLSLHFFPPFVFLHGKISTDLQAPTHPTCLVLGMPRATWWGLVATSSPMGMAQDESSAFLPAGSVLPGIWY